MNWISVEPHASNLKELQVKFEANLLTRAKHKKVRENCYEYEELVYQTSIVVKILNQTCKARNFS